MRKLVSKALTNWKAYFTFSCSDAEVLDQVGNNGEKDRVEGVTCVEPLVVKIAGQAGGVLSLAEDDLSSTAPEDMRWAATDAELAGGQRFDQFVQVSLSTVDEAAQSFVEGAAQSSSLIRNADGPQVSVQADLSMGSESVESLRSMFGPTEDMRGVFMSKDLRVEMSTQEEAAMGKMRWFCASILKKLAPPLLCEIESTAAVRGGGEPCTPRRVTRASASLLGSSVARTSKKTLAAEIVLLKALGIMPADLDVSDEAMQEFRDLFDSPVHDQHLRAMATIFGKSMPPAFESQEMQARGTSV
jgi:hypothetical protein